MEKQRKADPPILHGRVTTVQKPKQWKRTIAYLWRYLAPKKISLLLAFVCVLINIAASLGATAYLQPMIDQFLQPETSSLTLAQRFAGLAHGTVVLALMYLIAVLAGYGQSKIMLDIAQHTIYEIRTHLFEHVQSLPIPYHDTHTTGEMMSRFSNDVDTLNDALQNSMVMLFSSVVTIVGILLLMLYRSWILTMITILVVPLTIFLVSRLMKISGKYFKLQQQHLGEVNGYVEEIISGQKVVKVFGYEEKAAQEFAKRNQQLCETAMAAQSYAGMMMPLARSTNNVIYAVVVMVGGILAVSGQMSVGALVVFLQLTLMFGRPVNEASNQYNTVVTALAGTERIIEVLDEKREVIEEEAAFTRAVNQAGSLVWQRNQNGRLDEIPVLGEVEFSQVNFGYSAEKRILHDISLRAGVGQKIAFVGATGAGKTTILNLITRFYDIAEGSITLDGIDLREIKKASLRKAIAVVLQDTHLFTGTIRENIRYGKRNADDEEVKQAAKLANAHQFIKKLAKGYDTIIEGDGANLSQGQRQLLNIARAAIAKTPLLILDEATSSVDTRTERHIEQGLNQLMQKCTTFIVAHRLSTVRNADIIIVMEQGRIIERGSHNELLKLKGRYYDLYQGVIELD